MTEEKEIDVAREDFPIQHILLPLPKERIPVFHKGHRYQIWTTETSYGDYPTLLAEFTAPNDQIARKRVDDVLAVKFGSFRKAKLFLKMRGETTSLMNIDKLKELKIPKPVYIGEKKKILNKLFGSDW